MYICVMIDFTSYKLDNGIQLIIHEDNTTPLVAINILYKVGSKHEAKDKTGFAHLFEHLMFSGSKHVEEFDIPIQMAGGENNAFTNSDMTNFYNIVPRENVETVLWLESDRMAYLDINQESLDIQKKVVVEEFKEVCLNQPYGDMWHHMSDLAYTVHSYKWPTIGKDFSHIEQADLDQVKTFYNKFYNPENAIICIAGNIKTDEAKELVEKYFGWIKNKKASVKTQNLDVEPPQVTRILKNIRAKVPAKAIYMGFHMSDRLDKEYYVTDLITDILSNGRSSRFYQNLYKSTKLFSTIDAYISGTFDPGLILIEAKLHQDADLAYAQKLIWDELNKLKEELISEDEITKLINKLESANVYGEVNILNKTLNLAYYAYLGDTSMINTQMEMYQSITAEDIRQTARKLLVDSNCTEIIYEPDLDEVF